MNERSATERLTEALARASTHWAARRQEPQRGMTIAISREVGAGGSSAAREAGGRLGWPVYDHELLELIAREMNVRANLLESVDEKHKSWLQERVEAFSAIPHVSENAFVMALIETVLLLGAHGECVIVGRGAAHILAPATTLRVRLIAQREDRVERMSSAWNVPPQEALRRLEVAERERLRFVKDHFHKNVADPAGYDLLLNTSRFSLSQCADLTISAMQQVQHPLDSRVAAAAM
jgi:cytidylate kinase